VGIDRRRQGEEEDKSDEGLGEHLENRKIKSK
jgi:hypothetical protein